MADLSMGMGGGSGGNADTTQSATQKTTRESYVRTKNGDIVGHNFVVPKGDFARVMGLKAETPDEASGKTPISGSRVIEIALEKDVQKVGAGAAQHSTEFINMGVASGSHANEPGREHDLVKDGLEAAKVADGQTAESNLKQLGGLSVNQYMGMLNKYTEQSKNDNMRYMEMQYKFMNMSKQQDTISNLMKVRNDAVTRSVRGGSSG